MRSAQSLAHQGQSAPRMRVYQTLQRTTPVPSSLPLCTVSAQQCVCRAADERQGSHSAASCSTASSGEVLRAGSRRTLLLGTSLLLSGVALSGTPPLAVAEEGKLPKAYQEVVRKLSSSLRESIEAEQAGQKEYEVRRKADPAKEALQTFVKRWRDDPKVVGHPSHAKVLAVLSELGTFYQKEGPRARMPADLQERLLGYLSAAEDALSQPSGSASRPKKAPGAPGAADDEDLRSLLPGSL